MNIILGHGEDLKSKQPLLSNDQSDPLDAIQNRGGSHAVSSRYAAVKKTRRGWLRNQKRASCLAGTEASASLNQFFSLKPVLNRNHCKLWAELSFLCLIWSAGNASCSSISDSLRMKIMWSLRMGIFTAFHASKNQKMIQLQVIIEFQLWSKFYFEFQFLTGT